MKPLSLWFYPAALALLLLVSHGPLALAQSTEIASKKNDQAGPGKVANKTPTKKPVSDSAVPTIANQPTRLAPATKTDSVLPSIPEPANGTTLVPVNRIVLRKIIIKNMTALDAYEVASLTSALENRPIAVVELHNLRQRLTEMYWQLGYVNSGVILPDQRIGEGVAILQAIEGFLTDIDIAGNKALRDSYYKKRLKRLIENPLNANQLQNALSMLQAQPMVMQINSRLLPGAERGESILKVNVKENARYWARLTLDNYRSPSVDENRVSITLATNSLTRSGDQLAITVGATEGLDDLDAYYSLPLNAADLKLSAYYRKTDSTVVEEPFDIIDITSNSKTAGLSLSQPFRAASGRLLTATLGLENRTSKNLLAGFPFAFTPGEVDGKSEVTVAYLSGEWLWRSPNKIVGVVASTRFGVDMFGPVSQRTEPDATFASVRLQTQYARYLDWRKSQFIARVSTQLTPHKLLALEKYAVGGHSTVRGYRENQLVRDNGAIASLEFIAPLFVDDEGNARYNLQVMPFFDYGVAWDNDNSLPTSHSEDLASVGLGLRWQPLTGLTFNADYGHALNNIDSEKDTLQEKGFHFRIAYTTSR